MCRHPATPVEVGLCFAWAYTCIFPSCCCTNANMGNLGPKLELLCSITIRSHVRDEGGWAPWHSPGATQSSCPSSSCRQHLGLMEQFPLGVPQLLDWQRRGLGELFLKLETFGPFPSPGAQL